MHRKLRIIIVVPLRKRPNLRESFVLIEAKAPLLDGLSVLEPEQLIEDIDRRSREPKHSIFFVIIISNFRVHASKIPSHRILSPILLQSYDIRFYSDCILSEVIGVLGLALVGGLPALAVAVAEGELVFLNGWGVTHSMYLLEKLDQGRKGQLRLLYLQERQPWQFRRSMLERLSMMTDWACAGLPKQRVVKYQPPQQLRVRSKTRQSSWVSMIGRIKRKKVIMFGIDGSMRQTNEIKL